MNGPSSLTELFKSNGFLQVHRVLILRMGLTPAVYLSYIFSIIRQEKKSTNDWILIDLKKVRFETGLSFHNQRKSRSFLEEKGMMKCRVKGYFLYAQLAEKRIFSFLKKTKPINILTGLDEKPINILIKPINILTGSDQNIDRSYNSKRKEREERKNKQKENPFFSGKSHEKILLKISKNEIILSPRIIFNLWNAISKKTDLKKCTFLDVKLKKQISSLLNSYPPKVWVSAFENLSGNDWLHSQSWFSLDWLVKDQSNLRKVAEDQYHQNEDQPKKQNRPANAAGYDQVPALMEKAWKNRIRLDTKE